MKHGQLHILCAVVAALAVCSSSSAQIVLTAREQQGKTRRVSKENITLWEDYEPMVITSKLTNIGSTPTTAVVVTAFYLMYRGGVGELVCEKTQTVSVASRKWEEVKTEATKDELNLANCHWLVTVRVDGNPVTCAGSDQMLTRPAQAEIARAKVRSAARQ